jgi:hypothetical protein
MDSHGGMMPGENRRIWIKTCPIATLSTTNPTYTDPGASSNLRGERPVTNRLSHGTANLRFNNDYGRKRAVVEMRYSIGTH